MDTLLSRDPPLPSSGQAEVATKKVRRSYSVRVMTNLKSPCDLTPPEPCLNVGPDAQTRAREQLQSP